MINYPSLLMYPGHKRCRVLVFRGEKVSKNHSVNLKSSDFLLILALLLVLIIGIVSRPLLVSSEPSSATAQVTDTDVIQGIDVSHDQGDVNWTQVINSGVQFVYHKATDGITWQDPMFDKNIQQLSDLKVDIGPYHFFEAEDDPHKQAQNLLATIQGKPLTLAPMVDVEITQNQTSAQIQQRLKIWLEAVQQATGCMPIIYSYKDFWQENIGPKFNDYPFWLADYNEPMDAPQGIENLILWQFSETGQVPGITVNVDLDKLLSGTSGMEAIRCRYQGAKND